MKNPNANVSYISAGNFRLSLTVEDFKEGKKEMANAMSSHYLNYMYKSGEKNSDSKYEENLLETINTVRSLS